MQFSENSRVWIYQSDRQLSDEETNQIQQHLNTFAAQWTAHNNQLKATGEVRYNRFLILIVDETQTGASGCSIDKSVHFMKQIEQAFGVNLFDRFNLAYREGTKVLSLPRNAFEEKLANGEINKDTVVFNNLIPTFKDLQNKWEVPFKDSWHMQLFGSLVK
ncbi:ABC transporter ATPase [Mucilaginibacter auburnensis]|uniref:ABC transporter ATPase n=1 Tax=Mucilaginibacter auburnensis TaxID=1457233 RepID=A0A2H9VN69_9SPHI|nr:ABC transporter ATPase [Mucilaginibacter auburnensis]PJJ79774.1 hypothetical protein CLV57_2912 [Mucilaginibacter auburnensis]